MLALAIGLSPVMGGSVEGPGFGVSNLLLAGGSSGSLLLAASTSVLLLAA